MAENITTGKGHRENDRIAAGSRSYGFFDPLASLWEVVGQTPARSVRFVAEYGLLHPNRKGMPAQRKIGVPGHKPLSQWEAILT